MCDNVSNVIGLGLVGCNLQGALPMSLEDISTLQFLTLTNNAITKPLPQWTQLGSLLSLALGNNLVNDTLPDSWAALTSLQDFDMSNNPLTSTLVGLETDQPSTSGPLLRGLNRTCAFWYVAKGKGFAPCRCQNIKHKYVCSSPLSTGCSTKKKVT